MLIAGRKHKDALLKELSVSGGRLIDVIYGKGTVRVSYLQEVFGLIPEENKVVITCLLPIQKTDEVLEMLVKKFNFSKPNTGIAFTVPVDKLFY
ncbi:hypothetical protein HNQ56_001596 [Anaerotaenia torta]